jgi:hypothetical protein
MRNQRGNPYFRKSNTKYFCESNKKIHPTWGFEGVSPLVSKGFPLF